jgi:hypothetical protein
MTEWWHSLNDAARVFWAIALGATLLQMLLFAASLFGAHDFDHSPDGAAADSVEGVKLVSVRAVIAFLVGFGWTGGLLLARNVAFFPALGGALAAGAVFMLVIFGMMRGMMSLRADGTLNFQNAKGGTGSVYVTIPPRRSGHGQIEIEIQGRITTVQAVTTGDEVLPPQTSVIVDDVEPGNLLVVSRRS